MLLVPGCGKICPYQCNMPLVGAKNIFKCLVKLYGKKLAIFKYQMTILVINNGVFKHAPAFPSKSYCGTSFTRVFAFKLFIRAILYVCY